MWEHPETVEEFVDLLEKCDYHTRSGSSLGLKLANMASPYLDRITASHHMKRNLRMRLAGVLGDAYAADDQRDEASEIFLRVRNASASQTERASLAIRLVRFHAEGGDWAAALSEAEIAVEHFRGHRPKYETDLRSLAGALVARGNVFFTAMIDATAFPGENLFMRAERDFKEALRCASHRSEFCAIVAVTNLASLSLRSWWETGRGGVAPAKLAKEMKVACRLLRSKGVLYHSRAHAKARWLYGLASFEAYGSLNRSDENRLERALSDLLDLGEIKDAAMLALDLGYCYLRENKLDDMLTVTSAVLHHTAASKLPLEWRHALTIWERAIEERKISAVISETFRAIRGFPVEWEQQEKARLPRARFGDRSDTLGL